MRLRRTRRAAWVYAVHGGRVVAVGVATGALAGRPSALRADVRRLLAARATQAPRAFRPSPAQAAANGRLSGRTLAGASDPSVNAAFACSLQLRQPAPAPGRTSATPAS